MGWTGWMSEASMKRLSKRILITTFAVRIRSSIKTASGRSWTSCWMPSALTAPTIRINGEDMPQQVVKSRFLKLNSSHIEYVLEAMNKNPADIRNIRAYLLTALYNASLTIDNYYSALVNHDFYGQDRTAGSKKPKTYDYSLCEDTL